MARKNSVKTLSCGIIPVKKIDGEWQFLLLRCYKYWDFPKGHVEAHEDHWQAALRELTEETGLTKVREHWGKLYAETEVYSQGKMARYYLAEIYGVEPVKLEANPLTGVIEHHEHRWLSYAEARELLVPRVQKILDWAHGKLE